MTLRGDIDRNGKIDIVDAYLLARKLRRAEMTHVSWDLNSDGRIDRLDVNKVAMRAVAIRREDI